MEKSLDKQVSIELQKLHYLIYSIQRMKLDTINYKNKEIITPMGKSYCNARIQALNDVLEVMKELWGEDFH